jgi:hypothetical protein
MNLLFLGGEIGLAGGVLVLVASLFVLADVPLGLLPSKFIPTNKKIVLPMACVGTSVAIVGAALCLWCWIYGIN